MENGHNKMLWQSLGRLSPQIIIICVLFSSQAFIGCNSEKSKEPTEQIVKTDKKIAAEIFRKKFIKDPFLIESFKMNGKEFIFGVYTDYDNTVLQVISSFANSWVEESSFSFEGYYDLPEYYEAFESAYGICDTISNGKLNSENNRITFFYYITNGVTNAGIFEYYFALYDVLQKKHYFIKVYNWFPNLEELKFEFSEGLDKEIEIKKILESQIAAVFKNTAVTKESPEELNPYDQWMSKNGTIYKSLNESSKYFPLKFISVSENVFKEDLSQSEKVFSNHEFDIYSRFKGPVYLIEKSQKTYSIIWNPESPYDWIVQCNYENNHLYLFTNQNFYYALNMITKKIRKINSDTP